MRMHSRSVLILVGFLGLASLAAVRFAYAGNGGNPSPSIQANSSADAKTQQTISQVYANNLKYLQSFVAHGVDPRTLTPSLLQSATANPPTLFATIGVTRGLVYGHVTRTDFVADPKSPTNLPFALAAVQVDTVVHSQGTSTLGLSRGETIVVQQIGGPTWQAGANLSTGTGGSLAEVDTDPILLPGQSVLLFLQPFPLGAGTLPQPPAAAGDAAAPRFLDAAASLDIVSGHVAASGASVPYACNVNGMTVADLVALVGSASADRRATTSCPNAEPPTAAPVPKGSPSP